MRQDIMPPLIDALIKQEGWAALSPLQRKLIRQRRISLGLAWCGHLVLIVIMSILIGSVFVRLLDIRPIESLIARYWLVYPLAALAGGVALFFADRLLRRSWQTQRQIWSAPPQS